eukprot:Nitzschia sp. Nitz4//scaffold85_size83877//69165//70915//NITZ4_005239-RA/size83877-augustus-gene-0.153-mRNA-1//1//CDS//3329559167//3367//frame0
MIRENAGNSSITNRGASTPRHRRADSSSSLSSLPTEAGPVLLVPNQQEGRNRGAPFSFVEGSSSNSATCGDCDPGGKEEDCSRTQRSSTLISQALNSLSYFEREQLLEDIHGVNDRANEARAMETPQLISENLAAFTQELHRIKREKSGLPEIRALELAERMNIEYGGNAQFRLSFLRTRDWDVKQAVAAFIRHLDFKLILFGVSKLTSDLGVDDLFPEDMQVFQDGYFQVLPTRDNAGRPVFVWINDGQVYASIESMVRIMFVSSLMDEETQRRGGVYISFRLKPYDILEKSRTQFFVSTVQRYMSDMPIRVAAFHICLNSSIPFLLTSTASTVLLDNILHFLSPTNRARIRFHKGTHVEWCYELMTYGIPVQSLPLTGELKVKSKNHLEFLTMRRKATEFLRSNSSMEPILLPNSQDVLLGKGRPIQDWIGNKTLSEFIGAIVNNPHQFISTDHATIAASIVRHVKVCGGRFLSKDSGVWLEVPDNVACDKVLHRFRHRQKINRPTTAVSSFTDE